MGGIVAGSALAVPAPTRTTISVLSSSPAQRRTNPCRRKLKLENRKLKMPPPRLIADFQTPASLGYAMPAEWEQTHEATWIAWPHNHEDWPDKFEPIPWIYAGDRAIAGRRGAYFGAYFCAAVEGELSVCRGMCRRFARRNAVNLAHVTLHAHPTDQVWTRDSGPIFVQGGVGKETSDSGSNDFKFNAWARRV